VIPLITAQELVGTGDDPASQVAVELDGMYAHRPLIGPIQDALVSRPVEVLGWNEAMPELEAMMQMDIRFAWLIWPVLGIVVSIGVLNTLLMSLFERTRELGVLLAVGMRPRQVFALVVTEGIVLSGIGVALGLAAGALLTWPAVEWGFYIPLMQSSAPVDNVAFDGRFFSSWALGADLVWAVIFGLLGVVAAAWPAFRAARFDPVVSMRQA
jgi:ABC-type lipoprotein release transport system permease subunit